MALARSTLSAALSAALLLSIATPVAADEAPDKRRAMAVVEFRSGSDAAPDIGARIALSARRASN